MTAIVIAAGGTAGHVMPALAVAEELTLRGATVSFAGTPGRVEASLVPQAGYPFDGFRCDGLERRLSLALVRAIGRDAAAPVACARILRRRKADAVFGGGGFVAGPMLAAARALRIPSVLSEADAHLGLANRLSASLARRVFLAFPIDGRDGDRYRVVGRPVARRFFEAERVRARGALGLPQDAFVLAAFGAFAGALRVNLAVADAFGDGSLDGIVLHVSGARDLDEVRARVSAPDDRYRLLATTDRFELVLAAADLCVARAGGSVFELAACGAPAILVPYPYATADHQRLNAEHFARAGAAVVVADGELDAARLRSEVASLQRDPARLAQMSKAMRGEARPAAAAAIADELLRLAGEAGRGVTRRLHLLGIGGSGLSGIATVLAERGVDVSGCDRDSGGHDPAHLDPEMEVGYSGAVPDDEPELVEARRLGLPLHHRADLLAEIVAAGEGIAVAGSHGKTTTSGMIAYALSELGADPTFVVGGSLPQLGVNARSGSGRHVVVEADESDGSLVRLRPRIAVVLNVSHDHHDRYATRDELLDLLDGWTRSLAAGAAAVLPDGIDLGGATVRRFGAGEGEGWRTIDAASDADGARFVLRRPDAPDLPVALSVPGVHNAVNATAALAALDLAGYPPEVAAPVLAEFRGAGRRFETVGIARGVRFVDDYGHHPNEIAATLRVAREQAGTGRVILCLLPHQPFRVRHLKRELAAAAIAADLTCVLDVWVARGQPEDGIDGKLVVDEICRLDPGYPVAWTPGFDDAALWLAERTRPGDLVVGMGCGPVYEVGRRLLERLA